MVSILGCGWLGIPLAETLVSQGFSVKGSTTSPNKMAVLQHKGIAPFLLSLEPDGVQGEIQAFLDTDVLVIDIPPRFHFSDKIGSLVPHIGQSRVKKVLLISSISVYENTDATITEANIPNPKSEKSIQLFAAENILRAHQDFKTTVLRFGGLIGPHRHPVKFLAGQTDLENPDAPVNLIHLQDCIGIIEKIIALDIWGQTFNAAAPHHPTRENYYVNVAQQWQLDPPKFDHSKKSTGKTIDSSKLQRVLDYSFQFPDL